MPAGPFAPDPQDLRRLVKMARLCLTDDQSAELGARMAVILQAFASLQAIDTPATHIENPAPGKPLREDICGPPLPVSVALANAPRTAADAFLVPRIIEG